VNYREALKDLRASVKLTGGCSDDLESYTVAGNVNVKTLIKLGFFSPAEELALQYFAPGSGTGGDPKDWTASRAARRGPQ